MARFIKITRISLEQECRIIKINWIKGVISTLDKTNLNWKISSKTNLNNSQQRIDRSYQCNYRSW